MPESRADLMVVRLPLATWNDACRAAARPDAPQGLLLAPPPADDLDWDALAAHGLATSRGALDPRWRSLLAAYLDSRVAFRLSSSYGDMRFEAVLAVGSPHVCVTERFKTRPGSDGTVSTVAHDPAVEVAISGDHPWTLVRRVLPPLEVLRAEAKQTPRSAEVPLVVQPELQAKVRAAKAAEPQLTTSDALRRASGVPDAVAAALDTTALTTWLVTAATPGGTAVGVGAYAGSPERLYRASFAGGPAWEQVEPGDLAYGFDWHLLGALDVATAGDRS